jgi:hypothetical protein
MIPWFLLYIGRVIGLIMLAYGSVMMLIVLMEVN